MSFTPHTEEEIAQMLAAIGVQQVDQLFDEIPCELQVAALTDIPQGLTEFELLRLGAELTKQNTQGLCFIGAGAYEHHIPAAVWDIASRGEFMTAYTPYQAEASQGSLQLIYEYQTMMARLTGMEVSNASLYEGASALAEAVLMAIRANRSNKSQRVLVAGNLHPHYLQTVHTIVHNQQIELVPLPFDNQTGKLKAVATFADQQFNSIVIAQPNFFGQLEAVDELTDWAHAHNALVIACVNPTSLAILKAPGCWGSLGADIVCGEGQPLGVPLASGGPYFGFLCAREALVRQLPGRIVGRTVDQYGRPGFTLTLQAREQHIRRSKATSNICTNQGLLVTAATIYLSLVGEQGLRHVAAACHANTRSLVQALTSITGVEQVFTGSFFHEAVLRLQKPVAEVLAQLALRGIQGGLALGGYFPQLHDCLLVCATETKTQADIDYYREQLQEIMQA
jgi:glycine dehydrogenase subunit 1